RRNDVRAASCAFIERPIGNETFGDQCAQDLLGLPESRGPVRSNALMQLTAAQVRCVVEHASNGTRANGVDPGNLSGPLDQHTQTLRSSIRTSIGAIHASINA